MAWLLQQQGHSGATVHSSMVWLGLILVWASQGLISRTAFSHWLCSRFRAVKVLSGHPEKIPQAQLTLFFPSLVAVARGACSLPTAQVAEVHDGCQSMTTDADGGNGLFLVSIMRRKSPAVPPWQHQWGDPEKGRSWEVVSALALSISDLWEPDRC